VCDVVRLQVKAGSEAVDDHLKANVGHLVHQIVEQRRVQRGHVEEDRVLLRVWSDQPHLAFPCHVESFAFGRTHHQLVNAERLKVVREQNAARLRIRAVHYRLTTNTQLESESNKHDNLLSSNTASSTSFTITTTG